MSHRTGTAFVLALYSAVLFSCASAPKTEIQTESPQKTEEAFVADPDQAVQLSVNSVKPKEFFASVDPAVLSMVEDGSIQSLKKALVILKRDTDSISEKEKILANIASSILKYCWKIDSQDLYFPPVTNTNPYQGAIESALQGVYDYSTGKEDFFALVLPSLVLVTSETRTDYYETASEDLKAASQKNSSSFLMRYLTGVLEKRRGNYSTAADIFEKLLASDSENTELEFVLADSCYKCKRFADAFTHAKNIYDKNNFNSRALKLCARSSFDAGDYASAEFYVARVLQQESENIEYLLLRVRILIEKNDYIRAASLLDMYAKSDTKSRDYLVLRAKVQKDWNRNITAAASTIEQALVLYPSDNEIILAAAQLAGETGMRIGGYSALELSERILSADENNPAALEIKIKHLISKQDWKQAYEVSSRLVSQKNSKNGDIFTHVDICIALKKSEEAWNIVSELYGSNPGDEDCMQMYLKVLVANGRRQDASKFIEQHLGSSNAKLKSFLYYERSYLSGTEDDILKDLRLSLTANPRNKDSLFRLYTIYYNKREYKKAQYYLKQVVAISPADENLLVLNRKLEELLKN